MPCYYQSVSEVEIKDHEILMKALKRLGYEYEDLSHSERATSGRNFTIRYTGPHSAEVTSIDATFAGRLKQAYGVEAAKKELKKRGYRYKEIQEGKKVRLVVQG